ncbi:MAG: 3-hydroxyacyl-ACP dehydratase FabZ family protein [Planctomycetales bacterium]
MRFTLVDKILQIEAGKSITAIKNLSLAEEYLADHFPGFPVMPGVLMVESLVQASAWLLRYTDDFKYSTVMLKEARAVKFNNFVSPGQTMTVQVELKKIDERTATLQGSGAVGENSTVSAKLIMERFNLGATHTDLQRVDEFQTQKQRELFGMLWNPEAVSA